MNGNGEKLEQGQLLEVKEILPEAPASLNVRFSMSGYECLLTVRDFDEDGKAGSNLLRKLGAIVEALHKKGAKPIYGRNAKPEAKAEAKAEEPKEAEREHWCKEHNCAFEKKTSDDGRSWYSHVIAGTEPWEWCNEPKKKK